MLQSIRDHTQGWIAGTIISILIFSFALWGIHSYLTGGSATTAVASVNGVEITKSQLAVAYDRLRRQLQMQFSSNYGLPEGAEAKLKERALQTLINVQVLKQASINQNYRVSDRQVDSLLESMPEFQVNGRFSLARFQQVLSSTLFTPGDFIDLLKTSLMIDQPRLGLIFTSYALPNEVNTAIALVNQEREIRYAIFPVQNYMNRPTTLSHEQVEAYYNANQNAFKTQEQVSIEYIELTLKDLMSSLHPSESELKNFYNENLNLFTQPIQKNSKESRIEPFESVKDKVKDAMIRQQAEEKFASLRDKLANSTYEHPDTLQPAAQALGLQVKSTGVFTKEKGAKDISENTKIREAAFSNDVLNLQNNSDIIQLGTDSALVLRIKSHSPATLLTLASVEKEITEKLKAQEADAAALKEVNEIKSKLYAGSSPDQVAQEYHFTWNNVGFISRHATKVDSAILNEAFAMPRPSQNMTTTYSKTKVPSGYAVIALHAVKNGSLDNKKEEYDLFAEQIQNSLGSLEYELYKNSLMKQSAISIDNQVDKSTLFSQEG